MIEEDPLPVLDEGNLLASVKTYLISVHQRLIFFHDEKKDPLRVIAYRSAAIDRLLIQLYRMAERSSPKKGFRAALLSQGGYGRRELCLHSDIDILLLHDGKAQQFVQHLNEKVLQILWDAGLEVGFAVRTVRECRQMMDQDMTILTSLLDARYLAGDRDLFDDFCKMSDRYFTSKKNCDLFLQKKAAENTERKGRYGGAGYLLEPNLKEGEGGLRDYHAMHWYACVFDRLTRFDRLNRFAPVSRVDRVGGGQGLAICPRTDRGHAKRCFTAQHVRHNVRVDVLSGCDQNTAAA